MKHMARGRNLTGLLPVPKNSITDHPLIVSVMRMTALPDNPYIHQWEQCTFGI